MQDAGAPVALALAGYTGVVQLRTTQARPWKLGLQEEVQEVLVVSGGGKRELVSPRPGRWTGVAAVLMAGGMGRMGVVRGHPVGLVLGSPGGGRQAGAEVWVGITGLEVEVEDSGWESPGDVCCCCGRSRRTMPVHVLYCMQATGRLQLDVRLQPWANFVGCLDSFTFICVCAPAAAPVLVLAPAAAQCGVCCKVLVCHMLVSCCVFVKKSPGTSHFLATLDGVSGLC